MKPAFKRPATRPDERRQQHLSFGALIRNFDITHPFLAIMRPMPFAEVLVIIISQSKKVVARSSIVSLYSATNSLTGLGGEVVCGLSQENYQPATYMLGVWGAMPQMAIFCMVLSPTESSICRVT